MGSQPQCNQVHSSPVLERRTTGGFISSALLALSSARRGCDPRQWSVAAVAASTPSRSSLLILPHVIADPGCSSPSSLVAQSPAFPRFRCRRSPSVLLCSYRAHPLYSELVETHEHLSCASPAVNLALLCALLFRRFSTHFGHIPSSPSFFSSTFHRSRSFSLSLLPRLRHRVPLPLPLPLHLHFFCLSFFSQRHRDQSLRLHNRVADKTSNSGQTSVGPPQEP